MLIAAAWEGANLILHDSPFSGACPHLNAPVGNGRASCRRSPMHNGSGLWALPSADRFCLGHKTDFSFREHDRDREASPERLAET